MKNESFNEFEDLVIMPPEDDDDDIYIVNEFDWDDAEPAKKELLEDLDLSARSYLCLKRAGIDTVWQLSTYCREELMTIPNLSEKCIEEILAKLAAHR